MKKEGKYPIYDNGELHVTISKRNTKMGNIPSFSTLPGNMPLTLKNGVQLTNIKGTCGKHCAGCIKDCYAVRFCLFHHNSCIKAYGENTLIVRRDAIKLVNSIEEYCQKNIVKYFRFHTSGELESLAQLEIYEKICERNPDVTFYIYTKAFDILDLWFRRLQAAKKKTPDNLVINLSEWHGNLEFIKESPYKEFYEKCNIFAYDDGESGDWVEGMTHCPAVNKDGTETGVTCAECRRCMKRGNVTAVYAH